MTESQDEAPKKKRRRRRHGPRVTEDGSRDARKVAMVVLEVLAGLKTPTGAAKSLGVSTTRYYGLESQALAGLVRACEPRGRGPRRSTDKQIAQLEKKVEQLEKECARRQALLRLSQRTAAMKPKPAPKRKPPKKAAEPAEPGKRRPKKPVVRALRAVSELRSSALGGAEGAAE